MHPIVYVDGKVADLIGSIELQRMADRFATMADQTVDLLVHGESEYHAGTWFTGKVFLSVEELADA